MQVVIVSLAVFYSSTVLLFMQRGNNVLHLSIETGRLDVVQYLATKMGVHLYDINDEGDTALHKAALKGNFFIVEHFMAFWGFDVTVRNKVGNI